MKSITLFAVALIASTTVTLASNSNQKANHYLTSIESIQNNSDLILSKNKKVKGNEAEALSAEVENLKHQKTIEEVIAEDLKVIESNPFDTEFLAIESLKRHTTIEEIITENLKVIEASTL